MGATSRRLYPCVSNEVIEAGEQRDLVCSMLDTLGETRAERCDFKKSPSRLIPKPALVKKWRKTLGKRERPQIGISWRSMLQSATRSRHYLKASDLVALSSLGEVDFWILQTQAGEDELETLRSALNVHVPNIDLKDDFEGQAALISCLDTVISPLTTTAELAGVLGVPTVIFGRTHIVNWRRNEDGSDIWYQNSRFVTGEPPHDVPSLVSNIATEVATILSKEAELID